MHQPNIISLCDGIDLRSIAISMIHGNTDEQKEKNGLENILLKTLLRANN